MIFGELGGLKRPDICLTVRKNPDKNLTQETCPDRRSNPGPLRDRRASLEGNMWKWLRDSPKNWEYDSPCWLLHLYFFLEEGNRHTSNQCSWFWSLELTDRPKIHPRLTDDEKIVFILFQQRQHLSWKIMPCLFLERSRETWNPACMHLKHVQFVTNNFLHTTITENSFIHDHLDGCSSVLQD